MRKFRSGDDMVEAVQITDRSFDVSRPNHERVVGVVYDSLRRVVLVRTPQGAKTGAVGDWIIRTANGQLDLCNADAFAEKYEPWAASVLRFEKPPRGRN